MSQVVVQLELALEQQERKQDLELNEIENVSNDGINLSRTAQLTVATTSMPNHRLPLKELTNSKVVTDELKSGTKHGRKSTRYKLSRLWPWNTIWKRVKPSPTETDLLLSEHRILATVRVASLPLKALPLTPLLSSHMKNLQMQLMTSTLQIRLVKVDLVLSTLLRSEKAAVKKMDMQASKEFLAELKVLTYVHHLNLVRLIGYCVEGSLFIVYEYIENGNLSQHLRGSGREPLAWSVRVQVALDVARGLEYVHEHAFPVCIHRDIKPANILIDKNLRGKIADFGLTKLTVIADSSLPTGRLVGTFGYMPPEYAQYGDVSPKVDVYAYGVVVYEIISAMEAIVKQNGFAAESRGLVGIFEDVFRKPDPWEDLKKLVDPRLGDSYPLEEVLKVAQLARACTHENPHLRPSMQSVAVALMTLSSSIGMWPLSMETSDLLMLMSGR